MREGLLGWATDTLVKLDDDVPGVIARVLTAAPARRQAIFAALAVHEVNRGGFPEGDLIPETLAEVIRHGRVSDILRHTFGEDTEGLPGLLERIGDRPLDRAQDYISIHRLLVDRKNARAVDALRAIGRVSRNKLDILAALDARWHHANTLMRLDTPAEATRFNAAVEFVQSVCPRLDDEAVAAAITAMAPTSTLPRLLDRFIRRADRLPCHPISVGDGELRPFTTARDYIEAARRYRNCLAKKLGHVAAGRFAVAEFRGEALVEFRPLTAGGWMLQQVYGHRNWPVPLDVSEAAGVRCASLGIPRINDAAGGSHWRSFRSFAREIEWD